jgi:hypothetical protein
MACTDKCRPVLCARRLPRKHLLRKSVEHHEVWEMMLITHYKEAVCKEITGAQFCYKN